MVPGVTAALAAASALTLSLTHRGLAQRVQFVTGHDRHGALPPDLDLDALADPRATTCLYMGRETAAALARSLVERGLPPHTPAFAVTNVSLANEKVTAGTIGDIARGARLSGEGPLVLLLGAVLAQGWSSPGHQLPRCVSGEIRPQRELLSLRS